MRLLEVAIHLCCRELDCPDISVARRTQVARVAQGLFHQYEKSGFVTTLGEPLVYGVAAKIASRLAGSLPSAAFSAAQAHFRRHTALSRGPADASHALMRVGGRSQHLDWAEKHMPVV